jgi:hypothetical protein
VVWKGGESECEKERSQKLESLRETPHTCRGKKEKWFLYFEALIGKNIVFSHDNSERISLLFDILDLNGDKQISKDEIQALLETLWSPSQAPFVSKAGDFLTRRAPEFIIHVCLRHSTAKPDKPDLSCFSTRDEERHFRSPHECL